MKKRWFGIVILAVIILIVYVFYPRSITSVIDVENADDIDRIQLIMTMHTEALVDHATVDLIIEDRETIDQIVTALDEIKVRRSFSNRPDNHVPKNIFISIHYNEDNDRESSSVYIISSKLISINSSRYHASVEEADYSYFDQLYNNQWE